MNKIDRNQEILRLWLSRPPDKRTMIDLLAFTGELQHLAPVLLHRMDGDPYQQLKSILRHHITDF